MSRCYRCERSDKTSLEGERLWCAWCNDWAITDPHEPSPRVLRKQRDEEARRRREEAEARRSRVRAVLVLGLLLLAGGLGLWSWRTGFFGDKLERIRSKLATLRWPDRSKTDQTAAPKGRKPGSTQGAGPALDPIARAKAATVFVEVWYRPIDKPKPLWVSAGSGFVVRPDGLILTNAHVVSPVMVQGNTARTRRVYVLERVTVRFGSGTPANRVLRAQVVATRERVIGGFRGDSTDLALLRVNPPKPLTSLSFAPWRTEDDLTETTPVIAVGFPEGRGRELGFRLATGSRPNPYGPPISLESGTITSLMKDAHNRLRGIEHSCNTAPGSSGGPLVDRRGRVVGVHTLGIRNEKLLERMRIPTKRNYAVPTTQVAEHFGQTLRFYTITPPPRLRTLQVQPGDGSLSKVLSKAQPGDTVQLAAGTYRDSVTIPAHVRLRGAGITRTKLEGSISLTAKSSPCEVSDLTIQMLPGQPPALMISAKSTERFDEVFVHDVRLIQSSCSDAVCGCREALSIRGPVDPDLVQCEVVHRARSSAVVVGGQEGRSRPVIERLVLRPTTERAKLDRLRPGMIRLENKGAALFLGCRLRPGRGWFTTSPAVSIQDANGHFRGCLFESPKRPARPGGIIVDVRTPRGGSAHFDVCHFVLRGNDVAIRFRKGPVFSLRNSRLTSRTSRPREAVPPGGRPSRYGDFRSAVIPHEAVFLDRWETDTPDVKGNHFEQTCLAVGAFSPAGSSDPRRFRVWRRFVQPSTGNIYDD